MKIIVSIFVGVTTPPSKKKKIQQIGSRVSSRNTRIHLKNMMNESRNLIIVFCCHINELIWKTALRESPNESYRQAAHWVWRKREYAGKLRKLFLKKMFSFNTSVVPLWPQGDSNNQFIYYISGGYIVIYFLIFFISYVSRRREVT